MAAGTSISVQAEEPKKTLEDKWELIFLVRRGKKEPYTYTIYVKAKPKRINLVALEDPYKDKTFEAIYVADGDKLTINMGGVPRVKRPTEFGSEKEKGTRHMAFLLKRIKE